MKTKLTILLAILILGCSKENESINEVSNCDCQSVYVVDVFNEYDNDASMSSLRLCEIEVIETIVERYKGRDEPLLNISREEAAKTSKSQGCTR